MRLCIFCVDSLWVVVMCGICSRVYVMLMCGLRFDFEEVIVLVGILDGLMFLCFVIMFLCFVIVVIRLVFLGLRLLLLELVLLYLFFVVEGCDWKYFGSVFLLVFVFVLSFVEVKDCLISVLFLLLGSVDLLVC